MRTIADEKTLLAAYPILTTRDIRAALSYAADIVAHEEIVLSPAGWHERVGKEY